MSSQGVQGTIYLLHLDPPFKHASHYLGWTSQPVQARLDQHMQGQGSPLIRAAVDAGCTVTLVWTKVGDRNEERRLKNRGSSCRHCPVCRPAMLAARREKQRALYERLHAEIASATL